MLFGGVKTHTTKGQMKFLPWSNHLKKKENHKLLAEFSINFHFQQTIGILFGLNILLVPINISIFCVSPSKIFLQLLVPIKFSITTFDPYF